MKKTKKILAIAVLLMLILGSLTFVKAETDKLAILDGVKEANKVTFKINLPKDTVLKGDVDLNGKIESADITLIRDYLISSTKFPLTEMQLKAADVYIDGEIDAKDQALIVEYVEGAVEYNPITLTGTLANSSKYELVRDSSGNYSIVVTIPENATEGDIGVTVEKDIFMFGLGVANEKTSSELLKIKNSENNSAKVTISNGIKEDNKVTFKINLEKGTELRGDVNSDGKVDATDVDLLQKWLAKEITEGISEISSDVTGDGKYNAFDVSLLRTIVINNSDSDKTNDSILLDGDLKDKASYQLVKDTNGNFSIEVTIPEDVTEGTIGVILADGVFINADHLKSGKVSSELFSYSKAGKNETEGFKVIDQKDEKQDDGKIKVTVIVNKELDKDKLPSGWTLSEDGKSITKIMNKDEKEEIELVAKDGSKIKYTVVAGYTLKDDENKNEQSKDDGTTSNKIIPQTGATTTILVVIAGIAIFGIIAFKKYIKNIKIK